MLEEFNYQFSMPELDMKWQMFGNPLDTLSMIESQKPILEMTKEKFIKEMEN